MGDEHGMRRLIEATRLGGIDQLIAQLRRSYRAEVAIFDQQGNVLAADSDRLIWQFDAVLDAAEHGPSERAPFQVVHIGAHQNPIAYLAVRSETDLKTLLPAAADLVMMEFFRLQAHNQGALGGIATLIDDILTKRIAARDAADRMQAAGIDPTKPFRLILGDSNLGAEEDSLGDLAWSNLYALVHGGRDPFVRVQREGRLLMLVPADAMAETIAHRLYQQLGGELRGARVSISMPYVGGPGLRAAYHEALAGLRQGGVHTPRNIDLVRMLVATSAGDSVTNIAVDILQPIIDYDAERGSGLLATLHAYLSNDRRVRETADALFIHRNTLRYRLERIESLLGVDLETTVDITMIWAALTAIDDAGIGVIGGGLDG